MKKHEWFKIRRYPHIGHPITAKDKKKVASYIKNTSQISKHSFSPFIHKQIFSRKLRKEYDNFGNVKFNGKRQQLEPKIRDIYYASHLDANIYSYYSSLLMKKYETLLIDKKLNEVVTAYRKIPFNEHRNKCNIDFANDIFNYIKDNADRELVAIAVDVTGFFDNLDHQILKKSWCKVLSVSILPNDHYNVFKNITKFSYIEELHLFNLFQDKIIAESKSGSVNKKHIKSLKYMKSQGAIAFCEKNDIHRIRARGLIRQHKYDKNNELKSYGICQGSPISSTLANIYMLDFDEVANRKVLSINGLYRRYSDDAVIVCERRYKSRMIDFLEDSIIKISKLEIQPSKTQVFQFNYSGNRLVCLQEFEGSINQNSINRNFEYLGFSFDGEYTYLKTSSLASYYRKMKAGVRRRGYFKTRIRNKSRGEMFKRQLYKQYSYIGSNRSKKYQRISGTTNE